MLILSTRRTEQNDIDTLSATDNGTSVKCFLEIYRAIIHGATGVLFWNDWSKTPEVFDELILIMSELNNNLSIIKLNTLEKMTDGDQHVTIKGEKRGKKYISVYWRIELIIIFGSTGLNDC